MYWSVLGHSALWLRVRGTAYIAWSWDYSRVERALVGGALEDGFCCGQLACDGQRVMDRLGKRTGRHACGRGQGSR